MKAKVADLEKEVQLKTDEMAKVKQAKTEKKNLNTSGSNLAVKNIIVDISDPVPVVSMPLALKKKSSLNNNTRTSSNAL